MDFTFPQLHFASPDCGNLCDFPFHGFFSENFYLHQENLIVKNRSVKQKWHPA
jgi:hypothetical protein